MIKNSIELNTYGGYECNIKSCIIPYFEPKQLTLKDLEKNPKVIQDYYQYEILERKLTTNTVIHRHANIRKCLQYAYHVGLINSNPADRIERPKKNIFSGSIYSENELKDLFRLFQGTAAADEGGTNQSTQDLRKKLLHGVSGIYLPQSHREACPP